MDKKVIEKWLSIVILVGGILAFIISVLACGYTLSLYFAGEDAGKIYKGINKKIGTLAEISGIAAGALWLLRKIWLAIKKRKLPITNWFQQIFLLLRKHHIFFGILTLLLAFSHGVYFFLYADKDHQWTKYSGIADFLALILLALLGWRHQLNKKTKKSHITLAIIFGILFLIHLNI